MSRSFLIGGLQLVIGCGASIAQVPADQPHGSLELRFHQAGRDFLTRTERA